MINRNPIPQNFGKIRIELTPEACQFLASTTGGVSNWVIYNQLLCSMATSPTNFMKRGIKVALQAGQVEASNNSLMNLFDVGKNPMIDCMAKMVKFGLISRSPSKLTSIADMRAVVAWQDSNGEMVENTYYLPFVSADQDEPQSNSITKPSGDTVSQQNDDPTETPAIQDGKSTEVENVPDNISKDVTISNDTSSYVESGGESSDDVTLPSTKSEVVTTPSVDAMAVTPCIINTQLCLEYKESVADAVTAPQSPTDTASQNEASTPEVPPQKEPVPEPSEEDDKPGQSMNDLFRSSAGSMDLDFDKLHQQLAKPLPKPKHRNVKSTVNPTLADKRTKN